MSKFFVALLLATALVAPAIPGLGQKEQARCELGPNQPRNWEVLGRDYVYFDYTLCPANMDPPNPLVRIWITKSGNGIAVEKWAQDQDGADTVSVFQGKKKAYTLYRNLNAVPLTLLKAERRADVAAELREQPFMAAGLYLVPFENFAPESAKRATKVFESADTLIKNAQGKSVLLFDFPRIAAIVEALDRPLKAQN